jgi:uncharacterized protein (TIGR02145 family)
MSLWISIKTICERFGCASIPDVFKYGYLYNHYAVIDARNLTNTGWHIPTYTEWETLGTYIGGDGGKLKETGTTYWLTPNTGATNEVGFNARGSVMRHPDGLFDVIKYFAWYYSYDRYNDGGNFYIGKSLAYNSASIYSISANNPDYPIRGLSVRPLKNSTTLTHGQTGTYTGNDGKVYRTICINGVEYLADNLCETLYRNGDPIPEVTGTAAWVALVTGGRCSYNNDETYAL